MPFLFLYFAVMKTYIYDQWFPPPMLYTFIGGDKKHFLHLQTSAWLRFQELQLDISRLWGRWLDLEVWLPLWIHWTNQSFSECLSWHNIISVIFLFPPPNLLQLQKRTFWFWLLRKRADTFMRPSPNLGILFIPDCELFPAHYYRVYVEQSQQQFWTGPVSHAIYSPGK